MIRTLDLHDECVKKKPYKDPKCLNWETPLLEATDHMLDALMEHLEDCVGIIRSFFISKDEAKFKKVHSEFKKQIKPYRNHIGKVVNYIKHNQGRLRVVSCYWPGGCSFGYFVEGPIKGNALGPVADIHPDERSAFSYNRDMRFHLCCILAVSSALANALYQVNSTLKPMSKVEMNHTSPNELAVILERVANMPTVFFNDELEMSYPEITSTRNNLKIDYPANVNRSTSLPINYKVNVSYKGDGITSIYRIPYFGKID